MALTFYKSSKGDVAVLLSGSGEGLAEGLKELKPNTTDGAREKHVPVVTRENGALKVTVGSVPHPMLPEHYIEWIAVVSGDTVQIHYLKPGDAPSAVFADAEHGVALEYCNLHGLWQAEF